MKDRYPLLLELFFCVELSKVILKDVFIVPKVDFYELDKEIICDILIAALIDLFKKQIFPTPMADMHSKPLQNERILRFFHTFGIISIVWLSPDAETMTIEGNTESLFIT